MALDGGILGRTDDMVCVRGVNVYPGALDQIIRHFDEVVEYRVEVRSATAMTELAVLIEPSASCGDPARLASSVEKALRDVLSLRIPVTASPAGMLPRFEMKAQRWVRSSL
jgi:phenylacetate-CoA ligase